MNSHRLLLFTLPIFLVMASLLAGCRKEEAPVKTELAQVTISKPESRSIRDWDTYTGQVKSKEDVQVKAQVTGEVLAVKFKEGTEVKAGDVLFEINPSIYKAALKQAQGQLQLRMAEEQTAEKDLVRLKALIKDKFAAQAEYDEAFGRKAKATGDIKAAEGAVDKADINLKFCTIKAPIDGQVGKALVTKGNLIHEAGVTVMTTIVQMEPIYAEFGVDERALQQYKESRNNKNQLPAHKDPDVSVKLGLATEIGFPHDGTIDFVDNKVDPNTGTILIRTKFPNKDQKLVPGMFAKVKIAASKEFSALLVSDRALLTDQSIKYLLVAVKGEGGKYKVKRKDVEIGSLTEDGLRVIKSGIGPDDLVIVNGVQYARPEALVEASLEDMPKLPGKASQ